MKADPRFLGQPLNFWANVRSISEHVGYTDRKSGRILVPEQSQIVEALKDMGLSHRHVLGPRNRPTRLGECLTEYFAYRADRLNSFVEPRLMDAKKAETAYRKVKKETKSTSPITMNKQKGNKKKPAYLTAIVRMVIEANVGRIPCDFDPRRLTAFTQRGAPHRTLARRIDGAFPSAVDPLAVWEIKEYYHTTTFGSRVADGVYETLLDGMELREVRKSTKVNCRHYLMVDAHYTWWKCGRSYLCRIVDMLHMGYVDEVLFGSEVLERLPTIVRAWVEMYKARES